MKAAFVDRDGVLNELCYFPEVGVIDSPFTPRQVRLISGAAQGVRLLNRLGMKVVIVSNQPGVAKKRFSLKTLDAINHKLVSDLGKQKARIDAVYCCLHHPQAKLGALRKKCRCRKPKPGLILKAAKQLGLDLKASYVLGDSISDIEAGRRAGCRTIYIGRWKCDICRFMDAHHVEPDFVADNLWKAARLIQELEGNDGNLHRLSEL
jgi:D-glycero-D-manno-heptose 1,7-bisphosphate phosphatase